MLNQNEILNETIVLKIYKFCHSSNALSFYVTILQCGATSHFKMPRNRKRESPAHFKQVRIDVIKTHCRIKHRMSANIVRDILVEVSIVLTMNCNVNQENLVM